MTEHRIPIGGRLPTEIELMDRFSLSRSTVRQVLADLSAAGWIARQQGRGTFRIGPIQPGGKVQKSMLVGVWFNMPTGPLYAPVSQGIREELGYWGYHAVFEEGGLKTGAERRGVESLVRKRLDGFIVAPSSNPRDDHGPLLELLDRRVPTVLVDRLLRGRAADLVTTNSEMGAEAVVEHLIELGHRRIGFVGTEGLATVEDRLKGYRMAMDRHGLEVDHAWVRLTEEVSEDCGRRAARELFSLTSGMAPSAIFGANDYIAETIVNVARTEFSLEVPRDLSVAGFDDVNPYPATIPWLTTYAQPKYQLGRQAARLLIRRIQGESPAQPLIVCLEGELVVRHSTGPVNAVRAQSVQSS